MTERDRRARHQRDVRKRVRVRMAEDPEYAEHVRALGRRRRLVYKMVHVGSLTRDEAWRIVLSDTETCSVAGTAGEEWSRGEGARRDHGPRRALLRDPSSASQSTATPHWAHQRARRRGHL